MTRVAKILFVSTYIGLATISSVVGFALLAQFRNLESKLANREKELTAMNGRVTELERIVRQLTMKQSEPVSRNTSASPTNGASVYLNDAETQIIRSFIKVAPPQATTKPTIKIGDVLPQSASLPMSQAVIDKIPKLEGSHFAIDPSGAIAISIGGKDRVGIVITLPSRPAAN
jgi:uncharacterized coiled-coil protein SlyX